MMSRLSLRHYIQPFVIEQLIHPFSAEQCNQSCPAEYHHYRSNVDDRSNDYGDSAFFVQDAVSLLGLTQNADRL